MNTDAAAKAEFLRKRGFNVMPIVAGQKNPKAAHWKPWQDKRCDARILPGDSIAIIHGKISGTFAVDLDLPDLLDELLPDEESRKKVIVVKTPKQGYHAIFSIDPDDPPPGNARFVRERGGETQGIDVKAEGGYTLYEPSTHPDVNPDAEGGRYRVLHEPEKPASIKWQYVRAFCHKLGFTGPGDRDEAARVSKYDLYELMAGGFKVGKRRTSQRSYYLKKRYRSSLREKAADAVRRMNRTCIPPLEDHEVEDVIKYAESFFIGVVVPDMIKKGIRLPPDVDASAVPGVPGAPAGKGTAPKKEKVNHDLLAQILMAREHYVARTDKNVLYYKNGVYVPGGLPQIRQKCREIWGGDEAAEGLSNHDISEIVGYIREINWDDDPDLFDKDTDVLNFKNGLLNRRTGSFEPHRPSYKSITQYDTAYDPEAECPRFEKFLADICGDDERMKTTLLEMFALCFMPRCRVQRAFMLVGAGSNGKSVLTGVLTSMLGIRNVSAVPLQKLATGNFAAAALEGKAANISSDLTKGGIKETGSIKRLTGLDLEDCERKGQDSYPFRNWARLIFTANELLGVEDGSDGFWRRFLLVMFTRQFYGKDKDPGVDTIGGDDKGDGERSGIFNLLLPLMEGLEKRGDVTYPATVQDTRLKWLEEADSIFKFCKDEMVLEAASKEPSARVTAAYNAFCEKNHFTPESSKKLGARLRSMGLERSNAKIGGKAVSVWFGCRLKSSEPQPAQGTL